MIKSIYLKGLRNDEFLQFFKDIIARCNLFDTTALLILPQVTAMADAILKLDAVFNKEVGSKFTDLLVAIDHRRDKAITGIKLTCIGLAYHFEDASSSAAQLILDSFDKYNDAIARMNYQAETAEINAILAEWGKSTALTAALEELNMSSWTVELKTANDLFSETYQNRVDDKLETEGDYFFDLRPEAIALYKKLSRRIEAHSEIDEKPEYQQLTDGINVIIETYKTLLQKREGKKS